MRFIVLSLLPRAGSRSPAYDRRERAETHFVEWTALTQHHAPRAIQDQQLGHVGLREVHAALPAPGVTIHGDHAVEQFARATPHAPVDERPRQAARPDRSHRRIDGVRALTVFS